MKNTSIARSCTRNPSPRDEVIERCLPLVKSITARLRDAHGVDTSFEDLYALGVTGLMQAAERFDPTRGASFTTFAYYRIRGAILDSLRRHPEQHYGDIGHHAVRVACRDIAPLQAAANDNGQPDGHTPSARSTPRASLLNELATVYLTSLDAVGDVCDESGLHPDEEVDRMRLAERVRTALAALPDGERRVVELRYYEDLSFSEIGAKVGICKPWAFRLHRQAMAHLRETLAHLAESIRSPAPV